MYSFSYWWIFVFFFQFSAVIKKILQWTLLGRSFLLAHDCKKSSVLSQSSKGKNETKYTQSTYTLMIFRSNLSILNKPKRNQNSIRCFWRNERTSYLMTEPEHRLHPVTDGKTWKSSEMENSVDMVVYLTKTCPQKDTNRSVYSSLFNFSPNLEKKKDKITPEILKIFWAFHLFGGI